MRAQRSRIKTDLHDEFVTSSFFKAEEWIRTRKGGTGELYGKGDDNEGFRCLRIDIAAWALRHHALLDRTYSVEEPITDPDPGWKSRCGPPNLACHRCVSRPRCRLACRLACSPRMLVN